MRKSDESPLQTADKEVSALVPVSLSQSAVFANTLTCAFIHSFLVGYPKHNKASELQVRGSAIT